MISLSPPTICNSALRAAALPGQRPQPVTAAIVLWNTVYTERATRGLVEAGKPVDGELLQFLSPLGWEHINLTGDYVWRQSRRLEDGSFGPYGCPENLSVRFFRILRAPLSHLRKAEREDGRPRPRPRAPGRTRPARGPAPRPTSGRRSRSARRPPESRARP